MRVQVRPIDGIPDHRQPLVPEVFEDPDHVDQHEEGIGEHQRLFVGGERGEELREAVGLHGSGQSGT